MRRSTLLLGLLLLALLGAMAAKNLLNEVPSVRSTNPPGQFDANRAKARLAFILGDQRPHPSDTAAESGVRTRLVAQLAGLGLQPIVRDQQACNELYKQRGVSCARVRNIVAVVGPRTGKAILLNAHYDSTPVGPGAGDDGIGVATLLEAGALLKDRPLKRPVILLFNEGEELGLIGARAFLADPLSRSVDSLINLEARGVRGPANMFETSRPNGAAIALYSQTAAHPVANSLSTDVYRLLPNYTDVNSFAERGWLTLNLAPIGNETRYHSPGDDISALDPATLQHMGDQVLAAAEGLASAGAAPSATGDRIFMDLAGRALILFPLTLGIVVLVGLLAGFGWIAWRRRGLLKGSAVGLGTILGSMALAWIGFAIIGAFRGGMFWRAEPVWSHLAAYASAIVVAGALIATIGSRLDRTQLRACFWFLFLIIGGAIGLLAPGGIVFFLVPPSIVALGMLASRYWQAAERAASWIAIAFLFLSWGALLGLLEELLNGGPMWIFAPLGALIVLPVLIELRPLIAGAGPRTVAAMTGAMALAAWIASAAVPAYSADRQQRFVIQHVTVIPTGKSYWSVVNDHAPLPAAMKRQAQWHWGKLPYSERLSWLAPAPTVAGVRSPTLEVLGDVPTPGGRRVSFRIHANGALGVALIGGEDAGIRSAGMVGFVRPIDATVEKGRYYLECFGQSCDGATIEFVTPVKKRMGFTLTGMAPGLPPAAAPLAAARPRFARPQYLPDATVAMSRVRL